ncbi:unnamed protein product, partial [Plutella xylostella]
VSTYIRILHNCLAPLSLAKHEVALIRWQIKMS